MDELWERMRNLMFQKGRTAQLQWFTEELSLWLQSHQDIMKRTPWELQIFLSELFYRSIIDISNGTRSAVEAEVVS